MYFSLLSKFSQSVVIRYYLNFALIPILDSGINRSEVIGLAAAFSRKPMHCFYELIKLASWARGKSIYPFAPVGVYQVDMSASGFSGQLLANRVTKSGLLIKGRPKAIRTAGSWLTAFSAVS